MPTSQEVLEHGWRLHQAGNLDQAELVYRDVLSVEPKNANALVYLGIALFDRREFERSATCYRDAIRVQRTFPVAWNNLGNSYRMLGRVDEAEECFAEALKQMPGYLSAYKNRGTLWIWTGEIEKELRWYEEGLKHDPNNAELHRNLGVIYLLLGDLKRGFDEYRWRWQMPGLIRPSTPAPIWNGESLKGKKFLLYPEQGLGDAIQFVRVAVELQQRGAHVILSCEHRMWALFRSAPGVTEWTLDSHVPPTVDYHASMIEVLDTLYQLDGELAWGTDLFTDENQGGYLTVSPELVDYWKNWLDSNTDARRKRIGINWQGNPEHHADVYRSVPLETLRPLSELKNVQLINLQFGFGSEQLAECDFADSIVRLPDHVDQDDGAFTDTTAIVKCLDGVVTTDTSIAHLAGAVEAPVTMMLGRVPDWRWLLGDDATRWYPSMRLVRQAELGDWSDVVEKVCKTLASRTAA